MSTSAKGFAAATAHFKHVPVLYKKYSDLFGWSHKRNIKIVDIGCGPGHLLAEIEPLFPKDYAEIVGIDKEVEMVNYFNSVAGNAKISSRVLDIQTENLPGDLEGRFDLAFSSYCFSVVDKVRQAFTNTEKMLKPNGELFFIWCRQNQLAEIYKELSKTEKWAPYTSDFKNWKYYFNNDNFVADLKKEMSQFGLTVSKAELLNDIVFEGEDPQFFLDIGASLDIVASRIPKADLPQWRKDFNKLGRTFLLVDEHAEKKVRVKYPFPSIVVAAKKN